MSRATKGFAVLALPLMLAVLETKPAQGQQIAVQQPLFGEWGARTTIAVPDRGTALIGSVSRGASGRVSSGPFRSGTSTGREFGHSGMSAHVFIHDFAELDRQALAGGGAILPPSFRDNSSALSPAARNAWESRRAVYRGPEAGASRVAKSPVESGQSSVPRHRRQFRPAAGPSF